MKRRKRTTQLPIFSHTSMVFLKNCPCFLEAKHGNMQAAINVVNACCKSEVLERIKNRYPNATLLPVLSSQNKLPLALAQTIGLNIHMGVSMAKQYDRKKMTGIERLLNEPQFVGEVEAGKEYIIVDDIIAQGGTVAALRKYVVAQKAHVSAVVVLTQSRSNGEGILVSQENLKKLKLRLNLKEVRNVLKKRAIAKPKELTDMQVRYLLRFKSAKKIEEMMDKVEREQYQ